MSRFFLLLKTLSPSRIIVCVLAIALQVQVTILNNGNYLGLRVNLADFALPFFCLLAGINIVFKRALVPKWTLKYGWLWIATLLCVMTIALINGYLFTGTWSNWAFFNKYIGFWILIAYLCLGGWLITNAKDHTDIIKTFIHAFCGFFVCVLGLSIILIFIETYTGQKFLLTHNPWAGFMVNRNAYMVVAVFVMICILLSYTQEKLPLSNWISAVFWFFLPFFILHNASRTGWIVMTIFMVLFFIKNPKLIIKKTAPPIIAGIGLVLISIYGAGIFSAQGQDQYTHFMELINAPEEKSMYSGDQKRFIAVEDGLELYKNSGNQILGAGLGSYKPFQIQKRGEFIDVIDFTGLWLLTETGLLGLLSFTGFFIACVAQLFRSGKTTSYTAFSKNVLLFMLCFAGMTLLHELLYTRFLWFIMGLALAKPHSEENTSRRYATPSREFPQGPKSQ